LLAVLSGELDVQHEFVQRPLSIGKTLLVPACSADLQLVAAEVTTLLHVMLP
jgi:hypothetical protein